MWISKFKELDTVIPSYKSEKTPDSIYNLKQYA